MIKTKLVKIKQIQKMTVPSLKIFLKMNKILMMVQVQIHHHQLARIDREGSQMENVHHALTLWLLKMTWCSVYTLNVKTIRYYL